MKDELKIELQDLLYEHMNSKDHKPDTYKALEILIDTHFHERGRFEKLFKKCFK